MLASEKLAGPMRLEKIVAKTQAEESMNEKERRPESEYGC
jgi:hypothetical protein